MRCLNKIVAILLFGATLGCEVYQSQGRQCLKNPTRRGCEQLLERLTVNPLQSVSTNAQQHCLFNNEDVIPIREGQVPQEINGLKIWQNEHFLNVEAHHGNYVFNCIFVELTQETYVPLTYELVDWLTRE